MRALRWLLIAVVTVGVVLGVSPLALRLWLERELAEVGIEATFERLDLDYLLGEVGVGSARLTTADGAQLEIHELLLDFDWLSLGSPRVRLSALSADGAKVDVELLPPVAAVLRRRFGWLTGTGPTEQVAVARLRLRNVEVCRRGSADCLRLEEGAANDARLEFAGGGWELLSRGPVSLTKMFLREQTGGSALFYLGHYKSASIALTANRWRATDVGVENLQLLENPVPDASGASLYQTQIGELRTDLLEFSRDPWLLRAGVLQLTSPRQALERDAQGRLRWPEYFLARLPPRPESVAVSVEGINIQGGALVWQDHQQDPPVRLAVNQLKAAVGAFSVERPAEFTPLEVAFSLSPRGAVQLAGSVQNLLDPTGLDLKLVFEQLDLAQVAAYARPLLGGTASAGVLDMAVELDNRAGPYNGELRARLTNVQLTDASPAGRALAQQLGQLDSGGGAALSAPFQLPNTLELKQLPESLGTVLRRRAAQLTAVPQ